MWDFINTEITSFFLILRCQKERKESIEDGLIIALQEGKEKIPNVEKQKIDNFCIKIKNCLWF